MPHGLNTRDLLEAYERALTENKRIQRECDTYRDVLDADDTTSALRALLRTVEADRELYSTALTWIERHTTGGVTLVARALTEARDAIRGRR
jgi:hypothetical protein